MRVGLRAKLEPLLESLGHARTPDQEFVGRHAVSHQAQHHDGARMHGDLLARVVPEHEILVVSRLAHGQVNGGVDQCDLVILRDQWAADEHIVPVAKVIALQPPTTAAPTSARSDMGINRLGKSDRRTV